jgi:capsular polysaccharide transport system permease protein
MDAQYERQSFAQSLAIQIRVLKALIQREMITRYGRANLGVAWLFIEPMLFTLVITALWAGFRMSRVSAVPIVTFALTGWSAMLLWRNCANRASTAISPNLSLLYHRNVRVLDLVLSRMLLEIGGATVSFVVLGALWIALGWSHFPDDVLKVFNAWAMLIWFGLSLGLVLAALSSFNDLFERLWPPISYLLFPLSGAFFMVDWLPAHLRSYVLWLPMVHGNEYLRDGFFGSVVRTHYDVGYLATSSLLLTLLGLVLLKDASRRIRFQ